MNEEILKNLQGTVKDGYLPYTIQNAATVRYIKNGSGVIHTVSTGGLSNPTLSIYDNASGISGTVLLHVNPVSAGGATNYVVDLSFTGGLTAYTTAGNAPRITISYR